LNLAVDPWRVPQERNQGPANGRSRRSDNDHEALKRFVILWNGLERAPTDDDLKTAVSTIGPHQNGTRTDGKILLISGGFEPLQIFGLLTVGLSIWIESSGMNFCWFVGSFEKSSS
jgi:hypothetical protein